MVCFIVGNDDADSSSSSGNSLSLLDSDTKANLEQQLNYNLKIIQDKYANYVDCILTSVEESGVSAERFGAYLLNLPAFNTNRDGIILADLKDEIENADSVIKIFNILSTKHASFLDFHIFESIYNKYGRNKKYEDLAYKEHLREYIKKHKIGELVKINPKLARFNNNSTKIKIVFGIDKTRNLNDLKQLKEAVANILDLNVASLRIYRIKNGSVHVTLLVPTSIADAIFSKDMVFSSKQIHQFRAAMVITLECNGYSFDFREQSLQDSTSGNQSKK